MRIALAATLLIALGLHTVPLPAAAAPREVCLTKAEQRAALASGQAITLAAAIRAAHLSVRGRGVREVVNARLCRHPEGLRYVLTVLARDGRVTRATIDATSGKLVGAN